MSQQFGNTNVGAGNTKRVLLAKWLIKLGGTVKPGDTPRMLKAKIDKALNGIFSGENNV